MNFFRKKSKLETCDPNLIPTFSFENLSTLCKLVSFYDGDTCDVIIEYKKELVRLKCRLIGIDTPEIKSHNQVEKLLALRIRDYLSSLYHNEILKARFYENDKYGRVLVELFDKTGKSINENLVEIGMAYRYDGTTKKPFIEWYKLI